VTAAAGQGLVEVEMPARYCVPLPVVATSQSLCLSTNREAICGWSFREVSGNLSADMQIMDGQNNTGLIVAEINLGPGESIRDPTGEWPILLVRGIWIQINAGTVRGAVWAALT
jgi:hypothetical protein